MYEKNIIDNRERGEKMALIDVIEYEGSNDVLVYKYPHSDFSTMSQLIVRESQ